MRPPAGEPRPTAARREALLTWYRPRRVRVPLATSGSRSLRGAGQRGDAPADAGGPGGAGVHVVPRTVPDGGGTRGRRRGPTCCGRGAGLGYPGVRSRCIEQRASIAAGPRAAGSRRSGDAADPAGRGGVHGRRGGEPRLRAAGRRRRHQRSADLGAGRCTVPSPTRWRRHGSGATRRHGSTAATPRPGTRRCSTWDERSAARRLRARSVRCARGVGSPSRADEGGRPSVASRRSKVRTGRFGARSSRTCGIGHRRPSAPSRQRPASIPTA